MRLLLGLKDCFRAWKKGTSLIVKSLAKRQEVDLYMKHNRPIT